ncbi:ubiquitin-protein ligase [Cavenderia fasciculata]|uniref:RBR-type E3 ubiquitin transferase n=1 Tax=Cavenderia fasciculata TaxID=261658 RepID=F4PNS5_CACFS|nr:ubiquitin-protein ligase [Cavenderia fasciculata]EGG23128.1 ubiquitin-protein ligase [Cavenderia fasciculata]|eukprot:XP_004360979.1 ubiquitin-protein ligase [Cavenderia fasciculata]
MDTLLAQMVDMGFDAEVSRFALEQTHCAGVQPAIEFIYAMNDKPNAAGFKPSTPQRQTTTTIDNNNNNNNNTSSLGRQGTSSLSQPTKKIRTSIRDSNESFDSDEEYYQDVDDYEFDSPIVEVANVTNTVIQASEIAKTALKEIEKITNITDATPCAATLMLLKYQWNSNKLLEQYYEDPDRVMKQAGVPEKEEFTAFASVKGEDCIVCMDDLSRKNGCFLSCNHAACVQCWTTYVEGKISEGESISMTCLAYKCGTIVSDSFIKKVIPQYYNKYLERLALTFVDKNPNMRWCPTAGCGNALKADSQSESIAQCTCGFRICFKCNQESHIPASCDQVKQWKKKCEDDSETANWISSHTQDCPKCHSAIEKNGGCNHMSCKKCTHEFCWICMGNWKGHSNCNAYKKEENSNKSETKKALERYLFYFHRYNTHEQSKKFETKLRKGALDTIMAFQNKKDKRWIDVKFIETSTEVLIQCRRTLKYTYVFGFYLQDGAEKNLFEYLQNDLERTTENLSGMLEKGEDQNVQQLKEMTNLASTKLNHLIEGVEEGLTAHGTKKKF